MQFVEPSLQSNNQGWDLISADDVGEAKCQSLQTERKLSKSIRPKPLAIDDIRSLGALDHDLVVVRMLQNRSITVKKMKTDKNVLKVIILIYAVFFLCNIHTLICIARQYNITLNAYLGIQVTITVLEYGFTKQNANVLCKHDPNRSPNGLYLK